MDIYTLKPNFTVQDIVEDYESVVWTERYSAEGEVLLDLPDTRDNREKVYEGVFLSTPNSREVMHIQSRLSEKGMLKCKGYSLASILRERIIRDQLLNERQVWPVVGQPGEIMRWIVYQMCTLRTNVMSGSTVIYPGAADNISNLIMGPYPAGPETSYAFEYGPVYDAVKNVADSWGLGFTLYPANVTDTDYELIFTSYEGLDRTSSQTTNEVVLLSPATETLVDHQELQSSVGYKNVAYAFATGVKNAPVTVGVAYLSGGQAKRDFNRRVLLVNYSDITDQDLVENPSINLQAVLRNAAINELVNHLYVRMVNGQFVPDGQYQYRSDYNLGDILELSTAVGESDRARVTEYIQTKDASGYKAYPTLSVI